MPSSAWAYSPPATPRPTSFDELARVARPGGHIIFSLRPDTRLEMGFREQQERMENAGVWTLVTATDALPPPPQRRTRSRTPNLGVPRQLTAGTAARCLNPASSQTSVRLTTTPAEWACPPPRRRIRYLPTRAEVWRKRHRHHNCRRGRPAFKPGAIANVSATDCYAAGMGCSHPGGAFIAGRPRLRRPNSANAPTCPAR